MKNNYYFYGAIILIIVMAMVVYLINAVDKGNQTAACGVRETTVIHKDGTKENTKEFGCKA